MAHALVQITTTVVRYGSYDGFMHNIRCLDAQALVRFVTRFVQGMSAVLAWGSPVQASPSQRR